MTGNDKTDRCNRDGDWQRQHSDQQLHKIFLSVSYSDCIVNVYINHMLMLHFSTFDIQSDERMVFLGGHPAKH